MDTTLSPRQLADAIGVSESSIKRWVDGGEIVAARTAGGHRRIAVPEAIRFVRDSGSALARPDLLGLAEVEAAGARPAAGEEPGRLYELLRDGTAESVRGLLVALYLEGTSVARIVDATVKPAMARIGELWLEDEHGIFREHRATDLVIQALGRLRSLLPPVEGEPVAVGGAPAGDPYILPTLAVATVLESAGVAAVNLGPQTPLETLRLAADDLGARLVWLSVSHVVEPERLGRQLETLRRALGDRRRALIIGGERAGALRVPRGGLVYTAASMTELEALVRELELAPASAPPLG